MIGNGFVSVCVFVLCLVATVSADTRVEVCDGRPVGTFQRDLRRCDAYFVCGSGGEVSSGLCPQPFLFNEAAQACDWKENVDCFQCPDDREISQLGINGSCTDFIRCIERNPTHLRCPSGLQFDPLIQRCNLESLVNCIENNPPPPPLRCPPNDDASNPTFIRDSDNCEM